MAFVRRRKKANLRNVSWRAAPARWRLGAPPGFIRPCEPKLIDRPPTGPGWLHEVKHDGFRILARKKSERIQIWTRRGADFTDRFVRIVEAFRALVEDEALIDGEAVVLRSDGRSDFGALLTTRGQAQAALVAFDLLRLEGDDLRHRPLVKRREALARLIAGAGGAQILYSDEVASEGTVVFAKACELGLEGIVSKRAGSPYESGPSRNWLKTKNPDFVRL
jgi:bifunctional non-homologous end joining protein LigD